MALEHFDTLYGILPSALRTQGSTLLPELTAMYVTTPWQSP